MRNIQVAKPKIEIRTQEKNDKKILDGQSTAAQQFDINLQFFEDEVEVLKREIEELK